MIAGTTGFRPARMSVVILILHLLWVTGLGAYTLCIETDGARHAEWSGATCAEACDARPETADHHEEEPGWHEPPPCVACTDLTIDPTGFTRLTRTLVSAVIPSAPILSAAPGGPEAVLRPGIPLVVSLRTPSGTLPLRC